MPNVNYGAPIVLVYQALGLGELLASLPTAHALRRRFRDHRVVVAAPTFLHPLLLLAGFSETVPAAAGEKLDWPGPPPALAVNLQDARPQSHSVLAAIAPRRLAAYACPEVGFVNGPQWHDDEGEPERWARLVEWRLGLQVDLADFGLSPPYELRPGSAVIHPADRRSLDRFGPVAGALTAVGLDVVVSGWEPNRDHTVGRKAESRLGPGLDGALDLVGLICLVASATVVVTDDLAVARLARATGTPSVRVAARDRADQAEAADVTVQALDACFRGRAETVRTLLAAT